MKARLIPLHFQSGQDTEFSTQVERLRDLLRDEAEILDAVPLGAAHPPADAVVFPQMLGDAYRQLAAFKALDVPILVITSEFGTLSMWDWEIISYLESEHVSVIAPYSLEQAKHACRALAIKRDLQHAKFLVFQDNPGEGAQASIFKRFYWWEDECTQRILQRFGLTIERKSFKQLGAQAQEVSDHAALAVWEEWRSRLPIGPAHMTGYVFGKMNLRNHEKEGVGSQVKNE